MVPPHRQKSRQRMIVVTPPHPVSHSSCHLSVFLAGSIEMGAAVDWQSSLIVALSDLDCLVLNPRRPDWDSSWTQSKEHAEFRGQVEWELDGLDRVDVIALYFDPATKSPISLLELGMHLDGSAELIVYCPPGFWRKGNVDIVCERYGVHVWEDAEA